MTLSVVEKQDVLEFVSKNTDELIEFIGPNAEQAHREDGFLEITLVASLFMSLVISLGNLSQAAMNIHDLINRTMDLIRWRKGCHEQGKPAVPQPSIREKLLVILFEAYASNNKGLSTERLLYYSGESEAALEEALHEMVAQGIIRKTRQETWKYVRQ